MSSNLTERQNREREEFDTLYARIEPRQDFNRFEEKRHTYGPWNQYWQVYDFVRRHAGPGKRLLVYGCGHGTTAVVYAKLGYEVYGFDISPVGVAKAQRLAEVAGVSDRVHLSVQPAEQIDYPAEFFDVVEGVNILHHVDLSRALPELRRVLKPGGVAIFKDSLATPRRDRIHAMPPFRWILPPGTKNVRLGMVYEKTPDEQPLTPQNLAAIRQEFPKFETEQYRVLALFSTFMKSRTFLEKCDAWLFRVFPAARRLGDHVIIRLQK